MIHDLIEQIFDRVTRAGIAESAYQQLKIEVGVMFGWRFTRDMIGEDRAKGWS